MQLTHRTPAHVEGGGKYVYHGKSGNAGRRRAFVGSDSWAEADVLHVLVKVAEHKQEALAFT